MNSTAPCSSRFFRVLLPGFSRGLIIPEAFSKHMMNQRCTTRATLVNPNGKAWLVEVHKDKQSMYFEGAGWIELIHAHNLKLGYFLVFSYKGNMVFNFKAYDLSTCEIAYPSVANKIKIEKRSHTTIIKEEDLNSTSGTKQFVATMTKYNLSFQHLHIPVKFMKECVDHEFVQKHELTLKDPKGQSWPVRLLYGENSTKYGWMRIGNGWLQFARGNKLKVGDRCVFKLASEGEEQVMQVQILRK